jgi:RNA recognition motif-containing protein
MSYSNTKTDIYVSNLPYEITSVDLKELASRFGQVENAVRIRDLATDEPRPFGFVRCSTSAERDKVLAGLSGLKIGGRALVARLLRELTDPPKSKPQGPA